MEKELTDEQVERIVALQLKRLEDDYELTKMYDNVVMPETDQSKPQSTEELGYNENDGQDDEQNPYQLMGNDEQEQNQLFLDGEQEQQKPEQQTIQLKVQAELQEVWQIQGVSQTVAESGAAAEYRPEERPIDVTRIMEIATKIELKCPDWVNDPEKCQKRIRELFLRHSSS